MPCHQRGTGERQKNGLSTSLRWTSPAAASARSMSTEKHPPPFSCFVEPTASGSPARHGSPLGGSIVHRGQHVVQGHCIRAMVWLGHCAMAPGPSGQWLRATAEGAHRCVPLGVCFWCECFGGDEHRVMDVCRFGLIHEGAATPAGTKTACASVPGVSLPSALVRHRSGEQRAIWQTECLHTCTNEIATLEFIGDKGQTVISTVSDRLYSCWYCIVPQDNGYCTR